MKNRIILMSALAMVAFASCEKEASIKVKVEPKGVPFELTASTIDTKTTNSGMVTSWKADDDINLFHAEATTSDYSENDQFTITSANLAAKKFTGTLTSALDPAKSYDWYALFPYSESFTTPANKTATVNLGSSSRNQNGYDNTEHLANLPLVGKASNVAAEDKPAITMNQMAAVIKLTVTNSTTEDLTITSVSVTAPRKIVGGFIVDFTDPSNPTYTDGTYSYATANIKVVGGTALGNGESATIYIPIKPIALAASEHFIIKVNTYSKDVVMPSAFTFTAGKMTPISFNYDKTFVSKNFYLASSIAAGDKVMLASGSSGDVKVMSHYGGANNYPAVDGSFTGARLASTSAMGVFTVAGNSTDGYTLYDPETELYLTATNTTSNNYLKGVASTDDYTSWAVTISGNATITCKGKASRNVIKYNTANALFNAYNSDYTTNVGDVYILKQDDRTAVDFSFTSSSVSKTPTQATSYIGQTVISTPSVSPITYAMSGDDIGEINTSTGALNLDGTEGTAVVTATFAGDATYAPAAASYTITVVDPDAKYYRKVSSAPSDWAGTYLIVYETGAMALTGSANAAGTIKAPTDVTIVSGTIRATAAMDAIAVTIATNATCGYTIKTASDYYIYNSSSTKNGFAVSNNITTADDYAMTVAISDNNFVVTSNSTTLRYNTSNNIFQFYTSSTSQQAIQLYKRDN